MLHGRRGDPDPVIAGWLAGSGAGRNKTSGPANVLIRWDRATPALQAALARPLASRLDTFCQLRYRALAGPARTPTPPGPASAPRPCRRCYGRAGRCA